MPSSKGKPTDPGLREKVKEDVKNMEKGGGKGQMSAWKAGEIARQYEAKGGDYEDTGDNPNAAKKGDPKPKEGAVKKGERKPKDAPVGATKEQTKKASNAGSGAGGDKKTKSSSQKTKKEPAKGSRQQPGRAKKSAAAK